MVHSTSKKEYKNNNFTSSFTDFEIKHYNQNLMEYEKFNNNKEKYNI